MQIHHFTKQDSIRDLQDFDGSRYQNIDEGTDGVTITPDGDGIGWFSDSRGAFFYRELSGDFVIETSVEILRKDGKAGAPRANYSSAGLLIRRADSQKANASWIMYNVGMQNSFWGREIKVTRPEKRPRFNLFRLMGLRSLSTLFLIRDSSTPRLQKLRLARINGEYRGYYLDETGTWQQELPVSGMEVLGNGVKDAVEGFSHDEFAPRNFGLSDVVQAGIITNPGMNARNPLVKLRDAKYRFEHFAHRPITSFDECLGEDLFQE